MISRSTFLKLGLATALLSFIGGCSAAPMPVADAVVYVCPMHPEVTSTKPGELCPKCNMKLVPKK